MERQSQFDPFVDAITQSFKLYVQEYVQQELTKLREERDQEIRDMVNCFIATFKAEPGPQEIPSGLAPFDV